MWLHCCQRVKADDRLLDLNFKNARRCRKIYSKGSQTLRRSADCNITVLHCVIYIMGGQKNESNHIYIKYRKHRIPLFTLQGNFDVKKLHGAYRFMMNVMVKTAGKGLTNKTDRTPEEDDMLDMMVNGGKRVSLQNMKAITEWYNNLN